MKRKLGNLDVDEELDEEMGDVVLWIRYGVVKAQ